MAKPGQQAICEDPGYAGAREAFRVYGIETANLPVDSNGIKVSKNNLAELDAGWLYVTPAGQDPTGAVLSQERRDEILKWTKRHHSPSLRMAGTLISTMAARVCRHSLPQTQPTLFSISTLSGVCCIHLPPQLLSCCLSRWLKFFISQNGFPTRLLPQQRTSCFANFWKTVIWKNISGAIGSSIENGARPSYSNSRNSWAKRLLFNHLPEACTP